MFDDRDFDAAIILISHLLDGTEDTKESITITKKLVSVHRQVGDRHLAKSFTPESRIPISYVLRYLRDGLKEEELTKCKI